MNRNRAYLLLGALVLAGILALRWFQGKPELPSRANQTEEVAPGLPAPSGKPAGKDGKKPARSEGSGSPDAAVEPADPPDKGT